MGPRDSSCKHFLYQSWPILDANQDKERSRFAFRARLWHAG